MDDKAEAEPKTVLAKYYHPGDGVHVNFGCYLIQYLNSDLLYVIFTCIDKQRKKVNFLEWNITHKILFTTRMHSSGMRIARLLTMSQHALHSGVSVQGCLPGGQGVCPGGCIPACNGADPPVDRQTSVKA